MQPLAHQRYKLIHTTFHVHCTWRLNDGSRKDTGNVNNVTTDCIAEGVLNAHKYAQQDVHSINACEHAQTCTTFQCPDRRATRTDTDSQSAQRIVGNCWTPQHLVMNMSDNHSSWTHGRMSTSSQHEGCRQYRTFTKTGYMQNASRCLTVNIWSSGK